MSSWHDSQQSANLETSLPWWSRSSRALKQLSNRSESIINGIFTCKLIYGITVWGSVWNLQNYDQEKKKIHFSRLFGLRSTTTRSNSDQESNRIDFDLSLARGSFFFQSSRIWNLLPQNIKLSRNVETFKKATKTWTRMNITQKLDYSIYMKYPLIEINK